MGAARSGDRLVGELAWPCAGGLGAGDLLFLQPALGTAEQRDGAGVGGQVARLGAGVEDEAERGVDAVEPRGQGPGIVDHRHPVAAALFAGALGDALPVAALFLAPVRGQVEAAGGEQRRDAGDAQLRGLLHDPVHPVAAGDGDAELDGEGRFAVDGARGAQAHRDAALVGGDEFAGILGAAAVEEYEAVTRLHTQGAGNVPRGLRLQLDLGALGERLAGEKAGAVHGGVSP